jgi:hypothetical protein
MPEIFLNLDGLPTTVSEHNRAKYTNARYREVHALLIDWEEDGAESQGGLLALERILREKYSIITRHISRPQGDVEEFLKMELEEFQRIYSAPDILLIVYYSRHDGVGPELILESVAYG